jgi:hypothetical protein
VGVGTVIDGVGVGRPDVGLPDVDGVDTVGVGVAVVVGVGGGCVYASWPPPICWVDTMGRSGLSAR